MDALVDAEFVGLRCPEIPDRAGGWWHEYVCPVHGVELLSARGDSFPCAYGCVLRGEPYSGARAVLAHQAAARALRRLAVSGDRRAVDAVVEGLTRYADLYDRLATTTNHPDARPWMLSGRLFQQALTEAIWATSLAQAVYTIVDVVDHDRLRPAVRLLTSVRETARAARKTQLSQGEFRHNYTAWLNAAGAATSRALAALGAADETADWLTGEHGVAAHAAAAIHPDGWEWEASAYYHVFVLRACLLATRDCPLETLPHGFADRVRAMISVVATLATDRGGRLPAVHDTPYGGARWDDELYELCLLAAEVPDAPSLSHLAGPLAARLSTRREDSWRQKEARGWFGVRSISSAVAPDRSSRLFPDAGYAVMRGDGYQAILDYGPHGGSHGHLDKLSLYLYGPTACWQPALGVPPYAHPWKRGYYTRTIAHPTLLVDGLDQREATGRLLYWEPDGESTVLGASAEVYDDVRFERHVRADADSLVDVVLVAAPGGDREFVLNMPSDVDVQLLATPEGYHTWWPGDEELIGLHTAIPSTVLTTEPAKGPADDPQRTRPHLRWRFHGREAVFASVYSPSGSASEISVDRTAHGVRVHIDKRNGEPVRWEIGSRIHD